MKLYEIIDNSSSTKGYPWASGYSPLESEMPFIPPAFRAMKEAYWKLNPAPPGIRIADKGSKWSDFLGCGSSLPSFFISERVLQSIKTLNCEIMHATELPVSSIKSKKLKLIPPPRYFALQVGPGIAMDFRASNIPVDGKGNPILNPLPKPWPPHFVASADSWSGADIFSWSNYGAGMGLDIFCTEKVVDLAKKEKWTNVRFDPIDTI